jgi:Spy/CpxP family protein refolding chaperone
MKMLSTLTLAALMTAGAAFAATTPTATPAASATPAAAPAKHESTMHCEKQAKEKKLTGDEEKKFVKDCKEGKKAN